VVSVAEAVIDEHAVMVEFLYTPVAEVAVIGVFRSEVFAVDANVVQVVAFAHKSHKEFQEILLFRHIPRVAQCQDVEERC
jgi:hypothetical protein